MHALPPWEEVRRTAARSRLLRLHSVAVRQKCRSDTKLNDGKNVSLPKYKIGENVKII
jgi:hypothetical protein